MPGLVEVLVVVTVWTLAGAAFWAVGVARGIRFEQGPGLANARRPVDVRHAPLSGRLVVQNGARLERTRPVGARDLVVIDADRLGSTSTIRLN